MSKFSAKTKESLGFYVYVYSDPETREPFYVGKGKGNRAFAHLEDISDSEKAQRIRELRAAGREPVVEILAHGLDEATALKVEAAAIDLIGIDNLTNKQHGHESSTFGRIEASALNACYDHGELAEDDFIDNVVLIRINKTYRNGMTPFELYEATRGDWKMKPDQAEKARLALAVYDGMVIEVYEIAAWLPAGSTMMNRPRNEEHFNKRMEFVGRIADEPVRERYLNKSVASLYEKGQANPIRYALGKTSASCSA